MRAEGGLDAKEAALELDDPSGDNVADKEARDGDVEIDEAHDVVGEDDAVWDKR